MLIQLSIRDIVLIERLDLSFEKGLSVLTGETGAGKSILLDSLSLALGSRGDGGLVRHGLDKGQVTAVFDVPGHHPVRLLLRENGLDDDGDLIAEPAEWDRADHGSPPKIRLVFNRRAKSGPAPGVGDRVLLRVHTASEVSDGIAHEGSVLKVVGKTEAQVLGIFRARPGAPGGPAGSRRCRPRARHFRGTADHCARARAEQRLEPSPGTIRGAAAGERHRSHSRQRRRSQTGQRRRSQTRQRRCSWRASLGAGA